MKYEALGAGIALLIMSPLVVLGVMSWWIPLVGASISLLTMGIVRWMVP